MNLRKSAPWLLVFVLVLVSYWPAVRGSLLWDDDAHVTRTELQTLGGLGRIWGDLGATQQYYPVLHSAFWFEHRLWGDGTAGYHLTNLVLHSLAAGLFALILLRLAAMQENPRSEGQRRWFAWGAAVLFAIHPVAVESVAWISEQKNTLSLVFYLLSALAYLRFDRARSAWWYLVGLGCFVLALLSKSVTATLPCALWVVLWMVRGRLEVRRDVLPLLPWLVLGVISGVFSSWVERTYIGAGGQDFALGVGARVVLSGQVTWFYLTQLFWPHPLVFIYPRWKIDASDLVQWFRLVEVLGVTALLFRYRTRSRGPLAAWLFFVGSLVPVLGFVNVYPFIFSFVADHFQYLASLGVFAAVSGAIVSGYGRVAPRFRPWVLVGAGVIALALMVQTRLQSAVYRDPATLYTTTLERNPDAWLAHLNLGNIRLEEGALDEAVTHYRTAERLHPSYPTTHFNLGRVLMSQGLWDEAAREFQLTVAISPRDAIAFNNLGVCLAQLNRVPAAEEALRHAVAVAPNYAKAHGNLGGLLAAEHKVPEAIGEDEAALAIDPTLAQVQSNLAQLLQSVGREDDARKHFAEAARLSAAAR